MSTEIIESDIFYLCVEDLSEDDSDEFFDCEPITCPLEYSLIDLRTKYPHFEYDIFRNEKELSEAVVPAIPQYAMLLATPSGPAVIWVDRTKNSITYFDPQGKLAKKRGVDLKKLKDQVLGTNIPDEKILQVRCKNNSLTNLDLHQNCLNFLADKVKGENHFEVEPIPTLESTGVLTPPVFKPFGPANRNSTILERIQSSLNNHTILSGAMTNWDPVRIREGKLPAFFSIGGKEVQLETSSGTAHGCYFSAQAFEQKIKEMGGALVELHVSSNLPLLQYTTPIEIALRETLTVEGVMIPYSDEYQDLFNNLDELKTFCAQQNLVVLDRHLNPIPEPQSGILSYFSSNLNRQNLIIAPRHILRKNRDNISIKQTETFNPIFQLFKPEVIKIKAIAFPNKSEALKGLFEKLQIGKTNYRLATLQNRDYIIGTDVDDLFYRISCIDGQQMNIQSIPAKSENLSESGVVLMTMNQTSSFFQYPHEILTFLFLGASVMVYDNYGKGLSIGDNSERGIYETIEAAYRYLVDIENYQEERILAKGQCAGGPPTSKLGAMHPKVNIWIDQAPQSYSGMVGSLYRNYASKAHEMLSKVSSLFSSTFVRDAIVNSMILPQIVTAALPSFDVAEHLQHNRGAQLFTIGIPNLRGQGGDTMVPIAQQEEILRAIAKNDRSQFIPMCGAEHITDWWRMPVELEGVISFLKKYEIVPLTYLEGNPG